MDPVLRWAMVCVAFLPTLLLTARASVRLISHHPAVWARISVWRGLSERMGILFGDDHVALGDRVLSARIWQARFGALVSLVLMMGMLRATDPRCVALGL